MLMNDEQVAVYREALETEKSGYEHRVAVAKETDDAVAVKRYTNRIAQVDDEIARVDGLASVETTEGKDAEAGKKSSSKK